MGTVHRGEATCRPMDLAAELIVAGNANLAVQLAVDRAVLFTAASLAQLHSHRAIGQSHGDYLIVIEFNQLMPVEHKRLPFIAAFMHLVHGPIVARFSGTKNSWAQSKAPFRRHTNSATVDEASQSDRPDRFRNRSRGAKRAGTNLSGLAHSLSAPLPATTPASFASTPSP